MKNLDYWEVSQGNDQALVAKTVYLTNGKHNLRGFPRKANISNDLIGFKMHFQPNVKLCHALYGQVELMFFDHGYAGLELVENGMMNLALVIDKAYYATVGKDWDNLLKFLIKDCAILGDRLQNARPLWTKPLAVFGIPYGFIYNDTSNEPNLYHLGDQMAVIPSFCGDGMAIALHTAFLAVQYTSHSNANFYHKDAYKQLQPQIREAMMLARLVRNIISRKILIWFCILIPGLIRMAIMRSRVRRVNLINIEISREANSNSSRNK